MKRVKKLVAIAGEYTDNQGNTKKRYHTCGYVLERPDGSRALKIDSTPVGWNGWLSEYPLDEDRQQAPQQAPVDDSVPF